MWMVTSIFIPRPLPAMGTFQQPLEELAAGARVEVDERKNIPVDFVLWKNKSPGAGLGESLGLGQARLAH